MKISPVVVSVLLSGALPVVAASAKPSSVVPQHQLSAVPLAGEGNGLVLTPIPVPADDTREMLDFHLWKFNLRTPKPGLTLGYSLELREPDKEAVVVSRAFFPAFENEECALGLMPVDGESLQKADNLKIYFRRGAMLGMGLGGKIIPNALKALNYSAWKMNSDLHLSPEGEAVLMEFVPGKDANVNAPWTELVLVLHTDEDLFPFLGLPHSAPKMPQKSPEDRSPFQLLKFN